MLCADFPDDVAAALLRVLGGSARRSKKSSHHHQHQHHQSSAATMAAGEVGETIDFFEFLGGVNACLAFEELLGELEQLFEEHGAREGEGQGEGQGGGGGGSLLTDAIVQGTPPERRERESHQININAQHNTTVDASSSSPASTSGTMGGAAAGASASTPPPPPPSSSHPPIVFVSKAVLKGMLGQMARHTGRRGDQRWEEFRNISGAVMDDLDERIAFDEFALAVFQTMTPAVYQHQHPLQHHRGSTPVDSPVKHA